MKKIDYLIVGSGLFGAVFAQEAWAKGKKCIVIDRRKHTGGNIYCENINGINVHKYGPHIFHTNDDEIWSYVNKFAKFNRFTYSPIAIYNNEVFNLPFNMNTFYQLWKVKTPEDARKKIEEQVLASGITNPTNLEEQAISLVGSDIYEKLIKGYTEKQWGRSAKELPAFIIKRLPVRFTYDNNYFNDKYQGIPIGGYNTLAEALLKNTETILDTNYFENKDHWDNVAEKVVFTGKIDEYFEYKFGHLEYRSLRFENEMLETPNYQGNAGVNYTSSKIPFTRIIEHKHFEFGQQPTTVITKEYSMEWTSGQEPYYPINDAKNTAIFKKYQGLSEQQNNVIFGGRLAEYRYYDMHQVIGSALARTRKEFSED